MAELTIRAATPDDQDAIWQMLQPVFAAGETYAVDRDIGRAEALGFWFNEKQVFVVARDDKTIVGTHFVGANQKGGGRHVCNCGYVTTAAAQGLGVARKMLEHSLDAAKASGFRGMQFNFVVSTNERAIEIWKRYGFDVVGRLPEAFNHPSQGYVDALVMYRKL